MTLSLTPTAPETTGDLRDALKEEVAFWRRDLSARIWFLTGEYKAAVRDKRYDHASYLSTKLQPALASYGAAKDGEWFTRCEACGEFVRPEEPSIGGDDVYGHARCLTDDGKGSVYQDGNEELAARVAEARAALDEEWPEAALATPTTPHPTEDVAALRALSEKATPGIWEHRPLFSDKGAEYPERFITDGTGNLADDMSVEGAGYVCALVKAHRSGELVHRTQLAGANTTAGPGSDGGGEDDLAQHLLAEARGCDDLAVRASIERRFREGFAEAAMWFRKASERIITLEAALARRSTPATGGAVKGRNIATAPRDGTRVLCLTRLRTKDGKPNPEWNIGHFENEMGEWFSEEGADIDPSEWWPLTAETLNATGGAARLDRVQLPGTGSEERSFWLEAAVQHGFEETSGGEIMAEYDPPAYFATEDEVIALMTAARQQGRDDCAALDPDPQPQAASEGVREAAEAAADDFERKAKGCLSQANKDRLLNKVAALGNEERADVYLEAARVCLSLAAITPAGRGADAGGWRPIKTAPKEQQPILLALDRGRYGDISRAPVVGYWRERQGWTEWSDPDRPISANPTHWMPLPAAPTAPTAQGEDR